MAKRTTKKATPPAAGNTALDRAAAIAEKIAEQHRALFARNWREISEILDTDEEIKLAFSTSITDRAATPGEHADKDNSIKTTMSFSTKFSDSIESAIPDPNQQELPMGEEPQEVPEPAIG